MAEPVGVQQQPGLPKKYDCGGALFRTGLAALPPCGIILCIACRTTPGADAIVSGWFELWATRYCLVLYALVPKKRAVFQWTDS
jgi:hypothetical protein